MMFARKQFGARGKFLQWCCWSGRHWWALGLLLLLTVTLYGGINYYAWERPSNEIFIAGYLLSIIWVFLKTHPQRPSRATAGFIGAVVLIYLALHLPIFDHASWNANGLFDDAAWDIYLIRQKLLTLPWQTLRYDPIGNIVREYLFHSFMAGWLGIFGYTIKAFNYGLLFLGGLTVIFAALAVRLFFKDQVAWGAAVLMTLLPFHYVHQFLGHRYAIAPPLLAMAIYFFFMGQQAAVRFKGWYFCWTAVCLGLLTMSSIMGRQALYAALVVGVWHLGRGIYRWRQGKTRRSAGHSGRWYILMGAVLGLVLAPHLLYMGLREFPYLGHEQELIHNFLQDPHWWTEHLYQIWQMVFSPVIGCRPYVRFAFDTALMPYFFCPLWGLGLYGLLRRRQYWPVALNWIPLLGAYVARPYDFRCFLAVPAWFITLGIGWGDLLAYGRQWPARLGRWPRTAAFKIEVISIGILGLVLLMVPLVVRKPLALRHIYASLAVILLGGGLYLGWSLGRAISFSVLTMRRQYLGLIGLGLLVGGGLLESSYLLLSLRQRPSAVFAFAHFSVGRARMMQDLMDDRRPSAQGHRADELFFTLKHPAHYVGVCSLAYGIVHLYLEQAVKSHDIFKMCPGPLSLTPPAKIWQANRQFWLELDPTKATSYLFMWDALPETKFLYTFLTQLRPPGILKVVSSKLEGKELKVFYLKMLRGEFQQWQRRLTLLDPPGQDPSVVGAE